MNQINTSLCTNVLLSKFKCSIFFFQLQLCAFLLSMMQKLSLPRPKKNSTLWNTSVCCKYQQCWWMLTLFWQSELRGFCFIYLQKRQSIHLVFEKLYIQWVNPVTILQYCLWSLWEFPSGDVRCMPVREEKQMACLGWESSRRLVCSLLVHVSGFGYNEDTTESLFVVFTATGAPQGHTESQHTAGSFSKSKQFVYYCSRLYVWASLKFMSWYMLNPPGK